MRLAVVAACVALLGVGDAAWSPPVERPACRWVSTEERAMQVNGAEALRYEYDFFACANGATLRVWTGR